MRLARRCAVRLAAARNRRTVCAGIPIAPMLLAAAPFDEPHAQRLAHDDPLAHRGGPLGGIERRAARGDAGLTCGAQVADPADPLAQGRLDEAPIVDACIATGTRYSRLLDRPRTVRSTLGPPGAGTRPAIAATAVNTITGGLWAGRVGHGCPRRSGMARQRSSACGPMSPRDQVQDQAGNEDRPTDHHPEGLVGLHA